MQGPRVTRSFQERAAAAAPAAPETSNVDTYRMSFITSCLQVQA